MNPPSSPLAPFLRAALAALIGVWIAIPTARAEVAYALPTACGNNTSIGSVSWTNPGYGTAYDGNYATVSVNGTTSRYLACTGYGFAIPAGATINGIVVTPVRYSSSTANGGSDDAAMRLIKAGAIQTTDRSTNTTYTTSATEEAHGGGTDLWGTTWTPADINNANFGAALAVTKATNTFFGAQTVSVDTLVIAVYYTPASSTCNPPANIPAGVSVTCQCDNFGRAALNPSPIFGGTNWSVLSSDGLNHDPYINQTWGNLRLTENTTYNAKDVTVPGIFPAAGNYISVEFKHYAYHGTSADGIAITLSDYAQVATPGQYGGSLGYAQRNDCSAAPNCPGFNGGWVGVALDEFGNYQNPSEGRLGGPGFLAETVGIRGSGSGQTGYYWLQGNGSALSPGIDSAASNTPGPGYSYQVIVDARNAGNTTPQTFIAVNRDTAGGTNYSSVIGSFDIFARATALGRTQSAVPTNWKISFTGSTGASTNIHEIAGLRICASNMLPPSGGTPGGFNAVDSYYTITSQNRDSVMTGGDIFTKLANTGFTLKVAPLNSSGSGVLTTYAISGTKTVTLKLIDDSSGSSCNASASACSNCSKPNISFKTTPTGTTVTSQTMTFSSSDAGGPNTSPNFIVPDAYSKVLVQMSDGTTTGCSTDWFAVRPLSLTSFSSTVTSSGAAFGNAASSGTPALKAGTDSFTLKATAIDGSGNVLTGYNGTPSLSLDIAGTGLNGAGSLTPGAFATAATGGVATQTFTYSDVGYFYIDGYNPTYDTASSRGIYDSTWTAIDTSGGKTDCVDASYSNALTNGQYGCLFGLTSPNNNGTATRNPVGRFIPDHLGVSGPLITASIIAGTTSLVVSSVTGISVGGTLIVAGAGPSGAPLQATVKAITGTTITLSTAASTTVASAALYNLSGFAYMDQALPVTLTVTAYNGNEGVTANYAGSFAKLDATTLNTGSNWLNTGCASGTQCMGLGAVNSTTTGLSNRLSVTGASSAWSGGVGSFNFSLALTRPTGTTADATWGPFTTLNIGAAPQDADGVTLPGPTAADTNHRVNLDATAGNTLASNPDGTNERRLVYTTAELYGRARMENAYGSEFLVLPVRLVAEYYNGSGWVQNTYDSTTALTAPNLSALPTTAYTRNLGAGETKATLWGSTSATTLKSGNGGLKLSAPGANNYGSVSFSVTVPSYLQFNWGGSGLTNPSARATFGTAGNGQGQQIFFRENY